MVNEGRRVIEGESEQQRVELTLHQSLQPLVR